MRALGLALLGALGLGCNANPLLTSVTSDYAPRKAGSHWVYVVHAPGGDIMLTRTHVDSGVYFGRQADRFTLVYSSLLPPSQQHLSWDGVAAQDQYSAAQSKWIPYRRLPYLNGNRWPLDSTTPNVTYDMRVEGFEQVQVPAGTFNNCYKLKTITYAYDPALGITTTADSGITWAAPNVGDVKAASVSGTAVTVTLELTSWRLEP